MSWKGFSKGFNRAPQQFRQKFNMGEITKDAVYIDAERRFDELETETKKLHEESNKYFGAINGMLDHQIEFAKACAEIYKPISGRMSDPDSYVVDGIPEGIEACEEYERIVHDLKESLKPELEMIETRVVKPANELLEVIKIVRKTATKRDHKQLDYDRHRTTLKKLQDKKDKNLKDEKALYRAENDVEQATQEYNYFNDLLKGELPQLFRLEREFIRPLFQSFYYMQLNVFYTLHERMQSIDIGYFDLTKGIEEAFEEKRGDIQQETEKLAIVHFKTKGLGRPVNKYGNKDKLLTQGSSATRPAAIEYNPTGSSSDAPPAYGAVSPTVPNGSSSPSLGGTNRFSQIAAGKSAPPPPKPKPSRLSGAPPVETVTALYDYEAQAEGDLSFTTGDVIEIVSRTQNANEWWQGKVHGKQGQFPGNYVQLN
ncbi:BAR-domain-containing protein [Myriangium duriaei CBS 260.36]|uniref:BAR-domain-containing protein n=1 Tax=Myriangium duriaei CBS 260.36 TaxID=1168546 RepID=A0A9P4J1Q0_9PEZI|nr:BAR-domain-containing protein [Myriangium duriaei CBS 260.36]